MKVRNIKSLILAIPIVGLLSSLSLASGGVKGGDPYVIDFLDQIGRVCKWIKVTKPDPKLDPAECLNIYKNILTSLNKGHKALLTSTDIQLYDENGDPKPAVFDRGTKTIQFNWKEWKVMDDQHQFTTAATETSGLMDSDNRYSIAEKAKSYWQRMSRNSLRFVSGTYTSPGMCLLNVQQSEDLKTAHIDQIPQQFTSGVTKYTCQGTSGDLIYDSKNREYSGELTFAVFNKNTLIINGLFYNLYTTQVSQRMF